MRRPWMSLPENFELPRVILPAFAAAIALALIDGLPRVIGATIAVSISAALALKGLAAIHSTTRAMSSRVAILSAVYMTMLVLFPLPAPLLTALGLSAMLTPRKRPPALPPAANSNEN
jgi:ABC-type phosphate transport system permease subunit